MPYSITVMLQELAQLRSRSLQLRYVISTDKARAPQARANLNGLATMISQIRMLIMLARQQEQASCCVLSGPMQQ